MASSVARPEQVEDREVEHLTRLCRDLGSLGVVRKLLYARIAWDRLIGISDLSGRGALPPTTAKSQLTRDAARARWKRSSALRRGPRALIRALDRI